VASRDKWKRIEILPRLKRFLKSYREALDAWRGGRRRAVFPAGTYHLRLVHGCVCAGAG